MAEVGLLPFARAALQVSRAVLPRYRSRFSKHQFSQPQLLAILCLMRYEDWTFREAEVRLGEHRELRQALGLASVPDFTTLYRFLERLDDVTIDRAVGETVRQLRSGRRKGRRRARVAVDATGLAQGAVSTFFVRRMHHHGQKPLPWRHWLKWVRMSTEPVHLIGYLGKNPENKSVRGSDRKYAVLSLATQRSWKGADEEWHSKTEWHRVVAWNGLGEYAATKLRKGDHIYVEGSLVSSTFEREIGKGKSKVTVPFKTWQVKAYSIRKLNRFGKDRVPETVPVPAQPEERPF